MSYINELEQKAFERINKDSKEGIAHLLGLKPEDIVDNWATIITKESSKETEEHIDYLLDQLVKGDLTKDDVSNLVLIYLNR